MVKRKLIVVVVISVVVLGLAIAAGFLLTKGSKTTAPADDAYKPTVAEATVLEEAKDFNELLSLYNSGKFEESMPKAEAYAKNTAKDVTERLGAYKICITSALKLEKKDIATRCKDEALALAEKSTDQQFKDGWKYEIAVTYDPTLIKESENDADVIAQ